jgi:hypothetical protein
MACKLQCVDCRVTAHEADDGTLNRVPESAPFHQFEVDARRGEPCARGNDQMGDAAAVFAVQETVDSSLCELWGSQFEQLHALGGARKRPAPEQAICIEFVTIRITGRLEAGIAMCDARPVGHPAENRLAARIVSEKRSSKPQEEAMHIVRRHGSRDTIDIGV